MHVQKLNKDTEQTNPKGKLKKPEQETLAKVDNNDYKHYSIKARYVKTQTILCNMHNFGLAQ